jgi:hypothetical protein
MVWDSVNYGVGVTDDFNNATLNPGFTPWSAAAQFTFRANVRERLAGGRAPGRTRMGAIVGGGANGHRILE